MNAKTPPVTLIYIIAGEPSGDVLGARLMAALKAETGNAVKFVGVGGPEMEMEGLISLFPMSDLSVMGMTEVLPRLPSLIRRIKQTAADVIQTKPAALVTIDSPDFSFRVAKRVKGNGFPLIHYVAPSVWAWRPKRAAKVAQFLDHLLALLPFEPPYFEKEGLPCSFVGHPVVEGAAPKANGEGFRERHGIAADKTVIVVLPGSRMGEVSRHLPIFKETLSTIHPKYPDLIVVVVTTGKVAEVVSNDTANWSVPTLVITDLDDKFHAMAAGNVALAASGTVALELAATGTPGVIAYRMNALTAWIARKLIRVQFGNLINLILDREAVPERIQQDCRPDLLCHALDNLLSSPEIADTQRQDCRQALKALSGDGEGGPAQLAARAVLKAIKVHNG